MMHEEVRLLLGLYKDLCTLGDEAALREKVVVELNQA